MRLAHLADLHLGYRAYGKTTDKGVNQREADVADAFKAAIQRLIAEEPELVVVAGDVFHSFRPSNAAINLAFREFARLCRELPDTPVVIVAGNHDLPRSYDAGSILRLFANISDLAGTRGGCHVVDSRIETLALEGLDCAVTCVPSNDLGRYGADAIRPHPDFRTNVLVLHGTVEGIIRQAHDATILTPAELLREPWDYIALGHYHTHAMIAPHAGYSGSLERSSSNVWGEAHDTKGLVLYDTEAKRLEFVPVPQNRRVVDLPAIDAAELDAGQLDAALVARLGEAFGSSLEGDLAGQVVRQVVKNVPRAVQRQLDFKRIRQLRSVALHYDLKLLPPAASGASGDRGEGQAGKSLREELFDWLDGAVLRPGLDRPHLRELAAKYLDEAAGAEAEVPA